MSRNFLVPEFWVTAKISSDALRTAIAVGLHRSKEGLSYVKNEQLIELVGKNIRQIQVDLSNCEKAGLISKKFDETGKRYFIINMIKSTGAVPQHPAQSDYATPRSENAPPGAVPQHPPAQSECAPRRSGTALPPNNPPYRRQSTFQSTIQSTKEKTVAGKPQTNEPTPPEVEFVSFSPTASLPSSTPRQEPPAEIKRMASELQLESWLGELQFQGIDLNDWRVRYALCEIQSKGGARTAKYAWGIFRNQPETQPEPANEPAKKNGYHKPTYEEAQKEYDDFRDFVRGLK